MGELTIKGKLLTALSNDDKNKIYKEMYENLIESAREFILKEFSESVRISTILGQRPDQEVIRTIIRGIKVTLKSADPLILTAVFKDDYSHWYGGDLPKEIADVMSELLHESLKKWSNTDIPKNVIISTLF